MPPPMHPRPRAARPWTLPRRAPDLSSAPTLSTPLVATLTAAAAGRPPSLAATVIAPQSCCVAAMPAQCGSIQRSAPTRTPFLERRILPIRRVWRHVCISLESRLNGPKAPKFPAARTSRLEFRGADRSPEGALPVLFLIPHGNGTLFHFFSLFSYLFLPLSNPYVSSAFFYFSLISLFIP